MAMFMMGMLVAGGAICLCCECEMCEPKDEWTILQEAQPGERGAGWLNKRAKSKPIWSKRFFVLTDSKLIYYTEVDRQTCRGEIVIAGATASVSSNRKSGKKTKYFTVNHPECGERELYAKTTNRRTQWINAINELSSKLQGRSMTGKIFKQGGLTKNTWQERWAVCAGQTLDYFESPTENQSKGSISLKNAKIKRVTLKDQKFAFELTANNSTKKGSKTYVFYVEKEGDLLQWISIITKAISGELFAPEDEPGTNPIHKPTAGGSGTASAAAVAGGGGSGSLSSRSKDDDSSGIDRGVSMVSIISTPDEMRGYLMKKSPHALQGYQKRYFILRAPGELAYYGNEEEANSGVEPKGVISLKEIDASTGIRYTDGKNEVVLVSGKRSYPLRASSADEAESWAIALGQWCSHCK